MGSRNNITVINNKANRDRSTGKRKTTTKRSSGKKKSDDKQQNWQENKRKRPLPMLTCNLADE
jgi:hypothetical protein